MKRKYDTYSSILPKMGLPNETVMTARQNHPRDETEKDSTPPLLLLLKVQRLPIHRQRRNE